MGNALALVCPYDWPEPFGLVLIEALACGTPVLAYRRGSIPEVIDDGITGFVCENLSQMVAAVERLGEIDRRRCRASFEQRFTADRMARDYVALYERIIEDRVAAITPTIHALESPYPFEGSIHGTSNGRSQERSPSIAGGPHA